MIGEEWLGIEEGWEEVKIKIRFSSNSIFRNHFAIISPPKLPTTEEMLADLKINPTLWKEVVAGKKKLIGRRTEKNIENVEAPNAAGEMSPKLKE